MTEWINYTVTESFYLNSVRIVKVPEENISPPDSSITCTENKTLRTAGLESGVAISLTTRLESLTENEWVAFEDFNGRITA